MTATPTRNTKILRLLYLAIIVVVAAGLFLGINRVNKIRKQNLLESEARALQIVLSDPLFTVMLPEVTPADILLYKLSSRQCFANCGMLLMVITKPTPLSHEQYAFYGSDIVMGPGLSPSGDLQINPSTEIAYQLIHLFDNLPADLTNTTTQSVYKFSCTKTGNTSDCIGEISVVSNGSEQFLNIFYSNDSIPFRP
jgi:hypothetical protein